MKFELFIGLRYLKSKKQNKFISVVTGISIIGVAIGVMTLITVISVINGFQVTIREKIVNAGFHIYVTSYELDGFLKNPALMIKTISKYNNYFKLATPFFRSQAIIRTSPTRIMAIELFGIEPSLYKKDPDFSKCIEILKGEFDLTDENYILIGSQLKEFLGIDLGDKIEIIAPYSYKSGAILPVLKQYKVRGIFKSGFYEYDLKYAFISLKSCQSLLGRKNEVWGIGIRIDNIFAAKTLASKLRKILNLKYRVFTWADFQRNLFEALKNEKVILTFIVFLIIVVAAFNIASTLIMIVLEKKREIGILKAIGTTNKQIRNIFLFDGGITGLIGTSIGLILGILLSKNLAKVFTFVENFVNFVQRLAYLILRTFFDIMPPDKFQILSEDVYYFDKLPVVIKFQDVFFICIGAILISIIFSIIPAVKASKLNPVEAIRNE